MVRFPDPSASPAEADQRNERVVPAWLIPLCWAMVIGGIGLHLAIALQLLPAAQWARLQLLQALGMIVLALILLEQLFRNVTDDARWNVKPLCLALLGQFGFDLYLYSDALLFSQIDADALCDTGFRPCAGNPAAPGCHRAQPRLDRKDPSLAESRIPHRDLLIAAIYLLFMAAVGYYVRFFGGDWGRALQFSLLFASLLFLGVLGFSGSMRAKLRVLVGKHFFSYRYDYREEWLRFTQTLSSQESPQAMGEQVIRGLANMVESPAGGLWLKEPGQSGFRMAGSWNIPASDEIEDGDSSLCRFLVTAAGSSISRSIARRPGAMPNWKSLSGYIAFPTPG